MPRSFSRTGNLDDFGDHICQLRRRARGEHEHPAEHRRGKLRGHVPPAPPPLAMEELEQLTNVWRRLDVDADGILTPTDLVQAIRAHGLRGVSRQDAYDMLWEVSLQPDPGLSFEGFTAAYSRARRDKVGKEPRRLYNYIIYSLMDIDLNGTVSADEVYTHFYTYDADPGIIAGATWLLDSMPPGEEGQASPGLFVRYMQSGALASVGNKLVRPASAPDFRHRSKSEASSSSCGKPTFPGAAPPRVTARQKWELATAEMKSEIEHRRYDSTHKHLSNAADLSSMELRRSRDCLVRGITDVWGQREQQRRDAISRLREMREISRGAIAARNALKADAEEFGAAQEFHNS